VSSRDASPLVRIRTTIMKDPRTALIVGGLLGPPLGLRPPPLDPRPALDEAGEPHPQ
jgi:hypothetical protein